MAERVRLLAESAARLDAYISEHTELSRSAAQRLIRMGDVTVNDKATKVSYPLVPGDCIAIVYPKPTVPAVQPENIPIDVVYEDDWLAVINKPQGMVVHPSAGHESGTLVNGLLHRLDGLSGVGGQLRPGIVHRIDRMTSGLLVVAKNDFAHQSLSDQFRDHSAHRSYIAIAEGNFRQDSGMVHASIGRHPVDRKRMAVVKSGRDAVTHWRVVERMTGYTLLQLELETGRTHQIRVHLASIKHPVAGDTVYGCAKPKLGLSGQALHGYKLAFCHPQSREAMAFYAPAPEYFLNALRKAGADFTGEALLAQLRQLPDLKKESVL